MAFKMKGWSGMQSSPMKQISQEDIAAAKKRAPHRYHGLSDDDVKRILGKNKKRKERSAKYKPGSSEKRSSDNSNMSFGDAFKTAKKAGKTEFTWKNKKYHTRTREEDAIKTINRWTKTK